jgi:transposase-like protein
MPRGGMRHFICADCGERFEVPFGTGKMGKQMICPKCESNNVHRNHSDTEGWRRKHRVCTKSGK